MSLVLTKWEGMRYCCYSGNFSWTLGVYSTNKKKKSEKRILIDKKITKFSGTWSVWDPQARTAWKTRNSRHSIGFCPKSNENEHPQSLKDHVVFSPGTEWYIYIKSARLTNFLTKKFRSLLKSTRFKGSMHKTLVVLKKFCSVVTAPTLPLKTLHFCHF